MKKRLLIIALALIMVLSTACASNPAPATDPTTAPVEATDAPSTELDATEPEATAEPAPAEKPLRVAVLLPGLISDAGWNAGGYYGVQYLNENVENVEATYIENITTTQAEAAIRDYADQGYDLIVGWSFDMGDYLMKVAPDYPDTKFVWSQGYMQLENMATISAPLQETAYLCGMIAAGMSKTGVIGYIGGMDTMPMIAALEGYKEGAKAYNPDIKIIHAFCGTWSDTELGKQTAIAMFEQGVDVLMGRGDGIALGCFQACIEKGVYCFGDVSDQNELAPELLLTSTGWNVGRSLELVIDSIRAGEFEGKAYTGGMALGVCDLTDFHGLLPAELETKINEVREQLKSGELVIEAKTEISE